MGDFRGEKKIGSAVISNYRRPIFFSPRKSKGRSGYRKQILFFLPNNPSGLALHCSPCPLYATVGSHVLIQTYFKSFINSWNIYTKDCAVRFLHCVVAHTARCIIYNSSTSIIFRPIVALIRERPHIIKHSMMLQ